MFNNLNPLIMIVDPDDDFCTKVVKALDREGFSNIIRAMNGLEALVYFKKMSPYLVIMAADMPIKDGYSACELMRSLPGGERTSILLLVEGDEYKAINRAYKSGATEFERKPIEPRLLAKRAHYLLRNHHQMEELLRHEQRVSKAYRIARLGHWEWGVADNDFEVSLEVARMFRVSRRALKSVDDILGKIHEEDRRGFAETNMRVLEDGISRRIEFHVTLPDGQERNFLQWVEVELDQEGEPTRLAGIIQDVTEQRANEAKIYSLAHYDTLTGLPNRGYLKQHLRFLLEQAELTESLVAVVVIDIDHFGRINNALGYGVGDELLCSLAHVLSEAIEQDWLITDRLTPEDTHTPSHEQLLLLRTDADEFTLVISQLHSADKVGVIAERVSQLLAKPLKVDNQELSVTASMGISLYPLDAKEGLPLLECASAAVKHAKDQGRDNYQYFMQSLNQQALKRLGMESDLRKAVENGEFLVYFQPKVSLRTGRVDSMEALVRWQHPELGIVSPAEFVALAEDIGLIATVGEWVLYESCRYVKEWMEQGHNFKVAVNVSPLQFKDHTHLIEVVNTTLRKTGLPAKNLELELTESIFLKDTETNRHTASILRRMGIAIAIDDFGTGYSSLSYLTSFPVDTLKIDKSFVSCVSGDDQHAEVVRTIIHLAKSMNMKVVAEGIASSAEGHFLREAGCDYGQGYLYSPPLPASRFIDWVNEFHSHRFTA